MAPIRLKSEQLLHELLFDREGHTVLLPSHAEEIDERRLRTKRINGFVSELPFSIGLGTRCAVCSLCFLQTPRS